MNAQPETEAETTTPTILIVDDEVLVRAVIADFLQDCGYKTLEAANVAEAIEVLTSDIAVDIVFTDVEMPGELNGFGLAKWVREHRPEVEVLLTSGDGGKAAEAKELYYGERFFAKPVRFDDLHARLRAIVGGRGRP